jgi:hypothetical protein
MKKNIKYFKINIAFVLFLFTHNFVNAQNFEDKTIDVIVVAPVKLLSFNATKNSNNIIVTWKTATETDNSHFVVERSTNGVDFVSIGQVAGNNNSNVVNNYSFTDVNTPNVNLFYRLQQVDFSTAKTYSTIVLVKSSNSTQAAISIFPNPVKQNKASLSVSNIINGTYLVSVKSLDGKNVLFSTENAIVNNQPFQLLLPQTILKGLYIIQVSNNSGTVNLTQKLLLQ